MQPHTPEPDQSYGGRVEYLPFRPAPREIRGSPCSTKQHYHVKELWLGVIACHWVTSKLWEGLEYTSQSWPGRDNARGNGRILCGAFCQGGRVNVGPGRKSGTTRRAKIGQRTDAGKSEDIYFGKPRSQRCSRNTGPPNRLPTATPHPETPFPISHQEHDPRGWAATPRYHLSLLSVDLLAIFFTAFLIQHLTWGIIKPGIWKSLGKLEQCQEWTLVMTLKALYFLLTQPELHMQICRDIFMSDPQNQRVRNRKDELCVTVILPTNFKIKLSVRKWNVRISRPETGWCPLLGNKLPDLESSGMFSHLLLEVSITFWEMYWFYERKKKATKN